MAFNVDATILSAEFRGSERSKNKQDKPYILMRFETFAGRSFEVSTSDDQLFPAVEGLRKGEYYNLKCRMISSQKYGMIQLLDEPQHVPGMSE